MKTPEFEEQLAAYLGGELSEEEREQLERRLADDPALREELGSLQDTLAALRALPAVSLEDAAQSSAMLEVRRRSSRPGRWLLAGLKYAAVLIVGVGIGIATRSAPPAEKVPPAASSETVLAADVHPQWVERALEIHRRDPGGSSFSRQLQLLSAAHKEAVSRKQ